MPEPHVWLWATAALQLTTAQYWTTNAVENLGKLLSGVQHTAQGKDFELILTLKVETRHPIGCTFGREFLAFVIIAEL